MTLDDIEKQAILERIIEKKGHMVDAAKSLGIGTTTIYRKIKEYGMELKVNQIVEGFRKQQSLALLPEREK
jgi:DNA-binding NtrC family response regulator